MRISIKSLAVLATGVVVLGACQHTTIGSSGTTAGSNMAALEASQTQSMINLKDVLDASNANIPTLTAVGYAVNVGIFAVLASNTSLRLIIDCVCEASSAAILEPAVVPLDPTVVCWQAPSTATPVARTARDLIDMRM